MEKQGSRVGETGFPTRESLDLLKDRDYRLTSPMLTRSQRRFNLDLRYPQRISIRRLG